MIRPLRRNHYRIWVVLTGVIWVILVASLTVRRPTTPVNQHLDWGVLK
jgi:hypothetical protein